MGKRFFISKASIDQFFCVLRNMTDLLIIPASFYLVFHEVSDWDCILALRTWKLFQKYAHRVEVSSLYIGNFY